MNVKTSVTAAPPTSGTLGMSTPPLSASSLVADGVGAGIGTANHTVHMVTMSKGGVGKSLVAWNLVQYLKDKGKTVTAVDLDSMTHTLAEWKGLGARSIDLLTGIDGVFNDPAMDQLAEDMLTAESGHNFVLDNGASGFTALTRYLVDNEFPALLAGFNGTLVVHIVLAGGSASAQCLVGLNTVLKAFTHKVKFVVWVNTFAGTFMVDGLLLENMAIYKDMTKDDRVIGFVRLEPMGRAFLLDFDRMREERLTYGEAIASPKFLTMNKSRLGIIRRKVWDQLDALGLGA